MKGLVLAIAVFLSFPGVAEGFSGLPGSWRDVYRREVLVRAMEGEKGRLLEISLSPAVKEALDLATEGRTVEAFDALNLLRTRKDLREEATFATGLLYEFLGFYPEAIGMYRMAEGKGAFGARASLRRAFLEMRQAFLRGDGKAVRRLSRRFYDLYRESKEPDVWGDALLGYGLTLYELGYSRFVEDVYGKIEGLLQARPVYHISRAEVLFSLGRWKGSERHIEEALKGTDDPLIRSYLSMRKGDILVKEERDEEAERLYKEGISSEDAQGRAINTMALVEFYEKKGMIENASTLLEELAKGDTPSLLKEAALSKLIDLSFKKKDYRKVLALSRTFFNLFPDSGMKARARKTALTSLRRLLHTLYREKDYAGILALYYGNEDLFTQRDVLAIAGKAFLEVGIPDEAVRVLERAGRRDPSLLPSLAKAYILSGKVKEALGIMDGKDGKEWAGLYILLGDLYRREGKRKEALSYYSRAKGYVKDDPSALKLALIYRLEGRYDDALSLYRGYRGGERPYLDLADTYYGLGRYEKAYSLYRDALPHLKGRERQWALLRMGEIDLILGKAGEGKGLFEEVMKDGDGYLSQLAKEGIKEVEIWEAGGR